MKILHFILGKASKDRANGVNQVIAGLAKYSARLGAEVRVIGKAQSVSHEGERIPRDGFEVIAYSRWSQDLRQAILDSVDWADIVHLHGVYAPWNHWVGNICLRRSTPYIVTPHGGLAPERRLKKGRIRKAIYHALLQRQHLACAAAIHVISMEESTDAIQIARPNQIIYIPNGIDLEDFPQNCLPNCEEGTGLRIGYIGRLTREKNINALCEAFVVVNKKSSFKLRLQLAGPMSPEGMLLVKKYAQSGVEFIGPKFGQEKLNFLRSLDLFVHPALSEGSPIGAIEALAIGVPLLVSRTSNVSYFAETRAFFMCEPTEFGIESGMQRALASFAEWPKYVDSGRRLVEEQLNWQIAASEMLKAYDRINLAMK